MSYFTILSSGGEVEWTVELDPSAEIARVSDGMYVWINTGALKSGPSTQRLTVSLRKSKIEIDAKDPQMLGLVSSLRTTKETFNFSRAKVHEAVELQQMFRRVSRCVTNISDDKKLQEQEEKNALYYKLMRFKETKIKTRPVNMSAINPQSRKRKAHAGIEYED